MLWYVRIREVALGAGMALPTAATTPFTDCLIAAFVLRTFDFQQGWTGCLRIILNVLAILVPSLVFFSLYAHDN